MFSVGVSNHFKSRQLGKQISMCYHRVMGLAEQIGISWLFWYQKISFVSFCVFWQLLEVLHLMIHQILRILLCKIFYCFQHVLLPLLVLVMSLSTEYSCGVAVVSAEHTLRAGLSYCRGWVSSRSRGGMQPQTLGPLFVMPGGWQCPVGPNEPFWLAQELCRTELLAGPCCRCSQVSAVPHAGSSCACSAFPGQGALVTTRRWEEPWSKPWCAVRWQNGYTLRAMGAHMSQKKEDLDT